MASDHDRKDERFWDGGRWTESREARRVVRRPVTRWFWVLVVLAFAGVVPTAWAQQDFGLPPPATDPYSCAEEPWHVDPAGLRAFCVWWLLLGATVVALRIAYSRHRGDLEDDARVRGMLVSSALIVLLVPALGWAVGYMFIGMDCGP